MTTELDAEAQPGYRRRIAIEPAAGTVRAELEDDYHRMVVDLWHEDGIISCIESDMKRGPWTTCDAARAQLEKTFQGKPLGDPSFRNDKTLNCTHLYDLATFCVDHAGTGEAVLYDIFVSDPQDGVVFARLYRNNQCRLDWQLRDGKFLVPGEVAGKGLTEIGKWIAGLTPQLEASARILRWAAMIAGGRAISMPAGMVGSEIGLIGTCHTFQPGTADIARRKPGADMDFSAGSDGPMADRAEMFTRD